MLKKFAAGFALLAVLVVIALVMLWSGADRLVKAAIEQYGSQITGTAVHVGSVRLSLSSGEGTISGLTIANPKGFSAPDALEMGSITIRLDTNSLTAGGPIIIQAIAVNAPHVFFEEKGAGDSNLQAIQRHARSYSSHQEQRQEAGAEKQERKLIISDLDIQDGQLSISHALLNGKALSVPMSEIHLKDIGKDEDGASPAETAQRLIAAISNSAIRDANAGLAKSLDTYRPVIHNGIGAVKGLLGR